jgi:hypothetical protein
MRAGLMIAAAGAGMLMAVGAGASPGPNPNDVVNPVTSGTMYDGNNAQAPDFLRNKPAPQAQATPSSGSSAQTATAPDVAGQSNTARAGGGN